MIDYQWTSLVIALLDITVVAYLIYRSLLVIKGTRATPMLIGLSIMVVLYAVARLSGLVTLQWILGNLLGYIILIVVIIFQEEIRRGLTNFGLNPIFRKARKQRFNKAVEDITLVCSRFSESKTGALVVIQREVGLDEFVEDAVTIDAQLQRKLLFSIFLRDSPLHDGAVLIEGDRIRAAGCVLPLSFDPDLDPNLGTRHRAALGISERSDAIVIVVSEEDGAISLARDGKIQRHLDAAMLRDSLGTLLLTGGDDDSSSEDEG